MKKFLLLGIFSILAPNSFAANLGTGYILVERIDNNACGISKEAVEAAIATSMRQNSIKISYDDKTPITFYGNATPLTINGGCAVSYSMSIYYLDFVLAPTSPPKKIFSTVELCYLGGILTGPTYKIQSMLSDSYRLETEKCINKIAKQ
jgi:hypothetical protein